MSPLMRTQKEVEALVPLCQCSRETVGEFSLLEVLNQCPQPCCASESQRKCEKDQFSGPTLDHRNPNPGITRVHQLPVIWACARLRTADELLRRLCVIVLQAEALGRHTGEMHTGKHTWLRLFLSRNRTEQPVKVTWLRAESCFPLCISPKTVMEWPPIFFFLLLDFFHKMDEGRKEYNCVLFCFVSRHLKERNG